MAGASYGSIVGFETVPGAGAPTDALEAGQDFVSGSTVFNIFFMNGGSTDGTYDSATGHRGKFEKTGVSDADNAFGSSTHTVALGSAEDVTGDIERSGFTGTGLGNFFLAPGTTYEDRDNVSMIIDYTTGNPTEASGQIWDIEGRLNGATEEWTVTSFDVNGVAISSIASTASVVLGGVGNAGSLAKDDLDSYDSLPWEFSLTGETEIDYILVDFTGTAGGAGVAFDNFNATQVPEPTSVAMSGLVLVAAFWIRRRFVS